MKDFIKSKLKKKAQKLIEAHKPIVIAVSGSVGKTSACNAIATILSAKFSVAPTIENYNNEFGVPLTILGKKSPGKSIFGWLKLFASKPKNVAQVFVLEYAIDHPGDMKYLCEIAKPSIAVMTRISPVHAEFFRSVEALAEEKAVMLESVASNGLVVLNADDPRVIGLIDHSNAPIIKYGFSQSANLRATNYSIQTREDFSFEPGEVFSTVAMNVESDDKDPLTIELTNVLGKTSMSAILPAIVVARHLGLTNEQILSKVKDIEFEPGRMNPIAGIKGSLLIDSSYNAAPASMAAALEVLAEFHPDENARRIAALGNMAELGQYTEQEHRMIGMRAAEAGVDMLVTVGEMARDISRGAIEAGIVQENTHHFKSSQEAGRFLDGEIKKGDIVLIKGSQSARMEKVTKDLMAEPLHAKQLIVRQYGKWIEDNQ